MRKKFLITNDLQYIKEESASSISNSSLILAIQNKAEYLDGHLVCVLLTNNADNITVVGELNGNQQEIFDADGILFITPASWLNPNIKNLNSQDFKFIEACNADDLIIIAMRDAMRDLESIN